MRSAVLHGFVKLQVGSIVLVQSNCRNRKAAPMRLALRNFLSSKLITTDASGMNRKSSNCTLKIQSISSYRDAYIFLNTSSSNNLYKRRIHHKRVWLNLPLLLFLSRHEITGGTKRNPGICKNIQQVGLPDGHPL